MNIKHKNSEMKVLGCYGIGDRLNSRTTSPIFPTARSEAAPGWADASDVCRRQDHDIVLGSYDPDSEAWPKRRRSPRRPSAAQPVIRPLADITAMEPLVGRVLTDDHWLQAPEATGDVGRRAYPVHAPQRENPSKKNSRPLDHVRIYPLRNRHS